MSEQKIEEKIQQMDLPMQLLLRAMWSINHRIRKGADVMVIWEKDSILIIGRKFEFRAWYVNSHLSIVWEKRDYDNEYRIESKFKKVVVEISQDRAIKIIEYIHDLIISMVYANPNEQDIYLFIRDLIKPLLHP
jgi:hypothetical protein